ncbi:MAG: phenylalanine--tRNA ligase subunit beta [Spirochaetales bacterium]|nr:phenylalanine--tRNA ligase subunit beta [Spirochaetales bacterium]
MYISLNWIQEYVDIKIDNPYEFASNFTKKVVMIEEVILEKKLYDSIVTAKIIDIKKHPNADKLLIATCATKDKKYNIVTGAQNIFVGAIVPLALQGAIIPINQKKIDFVDFKGVISEGMLCSPYELKFSNDHSGIMILDDKTEVGIPVSIALNLDDVIFFIDNSSISHRPDLWGHYGIAREVAAIYDKPLRQYLPKNIEIEENDDLEIDVESFEDTPMYGVLHIKNITQKESPLWLKRKLYKVNQRSISLLVDLTNYIMFDLGEPCHAFDLNKIRKPSIKIRRANEDERVVTLDEIERICNKENLLICNSKDEPIALAGVMGLKNSEIDENTDEILLEVANFESSLIRKSSIAAGIRTEASNRFEKSLDPSFIDLAINKFAYTLASIDKDIKILGKKIAFEKPPKKNKIIMPVDLINRRLGTIVEEETIAKILKKLEFDLTLENGVLNITVPTFRSTKDIKIPEDIVEEVGRIYGYDNIIPEAPSIKLDIAPQIELPNYKRKVKEFLSNNLNFTEVLNYPFTTIEMNNLFGFKPPFVQIKNPLNSEKPYLTKTLLPNILTNVKTNLRYFDEFKIYEVEHVFVQDEDGAISEPVEIAGALVYKDFNLSIIDARDTILSICNLFNIDEITISTSNIPSFLHPYKSGVVYYENNIIGVFGEIHPDVAKFFDIRNRVSIFSCYLDTFIKFKGNTKKFSQISKFPDVSFDLAFVVPIKTYVNQIINLIKSADENIRKVELFDIFQGGNLPSDKKSIAFNITVNSFEKTLNSEDEQRIIKKIVSLMEKEGFEIRK